MRIGIDARFFGSKGKGLGRYTQKLIENFEKIDKENQYVIFLRRENWEEYMPSPPNFKKVLADYRWYSLAEQIFLPIKICRQRINLMHFPHFNVPIFYFGRFVVTIHDLILRHFSTRRASALGPLTYWIKTLAYRIVIWLAVKRAEKIIAVSNYVKKDIISAFGVIADKVAVTYEGAGEKISNFQFPISNLLSKFKIRKPYLFYVGNAYPHKNLERLIEAFEILIEKYNQDLRLVLVGEDDYFYQRLRKEIFDAVSHDRIIFMGFVSDEELAVLYQNAALYVFPSLCEGFGLPPLEAMAHSVPVVSSDATCLPEILGEAAVYFDALNPQDMAEKINKVLTENALRQKLITAGFEQIKKYSWQKMAEETLRLYRN